MRVKIVCRERENSHSHMCTRNTWKMRKTFPFSTLLNPACHYSFTIHPIQWALNILQWKKELSLIASNANHKSNNTHLQRSKLSSLSEATAEKLQQNKLNNNRPIFIDDNDDDFEGSGRKGEVSRLASPFILSDKVIWVNAERKG